MGLDYRCRTVVVKSKKVQERKARPSFEETELPYSSQACCRLHSPNQIWCGSVGAPYFRDKTAEIHASACDTQ